MTASPMRFGILISAADEIVRTADRMKLGGEDARVLAAHLEHAARRIRVGGECREAELMPVITRRPLSRQYGRA